MHLEHRLILLRELQNDLKKKTEDFRKEHPDQDKLDAKAKGELEELGNEEKDIIELYNELRRDPGEPPDDGAKDKDKDKDQDKDKDKKPAEGEKKP